MFTFVFIKHDDEKKLQLYNGESVVMAMHECQKPMKMTSKLRHLASETCIIPYADDSL